LKAVFHFPWIEVVRVFLPRATAFGRHGARRRVALATLIGFTPWFREILGLFLTPVNKGIFKVQEHLFDGRHRDSLDLGQTVVRSPVLIFGFFHLQDRGDFPIVLDFNK